jgi:hypothetical protein
LPARVRALSLTICKLQQPLIGICPAKVILGTDSILWRQTEEKEHTYPAIAIESSAIHLDPNHSHFILVEDEEGTGFGVEHALRGELLKCLGGEEAYEGHEEDSSHRVPVVSICGTEPCTQHHDTRASARSTL